MTRRERTKGQSAGRTGGRRFNRTASPSYRSKGSLVPTDQVLRLRRRWLPIACLGLTGVGAAVAVAFASRDQAESDPPALSSSQADRIRRLLRDVTGGSAPGALVVVRRGDRRFAFASGLASLRPRAKLRPTDRFRIGSVTKTFVAAIVLQLVEEGRLALDDPVARWTPGLVPDDERITLRMLLNHTSGLYDYLDDPSVLGIHERRPRHHWAPRTLVAISNRHPPLFAPGARWRYSNTNYVVAGLIVEAATGRRLEQQLDERIFVPLDLSMSSLESGSLLSRRQVHAYIRDPRGRLSDAARVSASSAWAAGAVVSTGDDVAQFLRALLGGRLLPSRLITKMLQGPRVRDDAFISRYGLGLFALQTRCGQAWGHDGEIFGYQTAAFADRRGEIAVVVLANAIGEPWWVRPVVDEALCPA